jgi:hypothetical protein
MDYIHRENMSIEEDQDQQQPELSSKLSSSSSSLSLSPDIRLARAMRKTGNYSNERMAQLLDYFNAAARKRRGRR